jgi:hypothetical protein
LEVSPPEPGLPRTTSEAFILLLALTTTKAKKRPLLAERLVSRKTELDYLRRRRNSSAPVPKPINASVDGSGTLATVNGVRAGPNSPTG